MNKLQDWLGRRPARFALLLYLSVGLFQLWIIPAGLQSWLGLHWMEAVIGAAVLAWIPLLGQALGLATAVDVLNWPVFASLGLFLWPVWLVAVALVARRLGGGHGSARPGGRGDVIDRGFDAYRHHRVNARKHTGDLSPQERTAA